MPCVVRADMVTSFDGPTLDANLHLDVPDPGVGTVSLDTVNHSLLFYGTGADLWDTRNGLPYAWTDIPQVGVGGVWRAETEVHYNVPEHVTDFGYNWGRIAGITTYAGPDGSGGSYAGQEFTFQLDQWDDPYGVWVQGLGDHAPGNLPVDLHDDGLITDTVRLRMDVTVGDANYNTYDFYYKLLPADTWTLLGTIQYASDDTRVALFFKGGNNTDGDMNVSFNYYNVTTVSGVPEPGVMALAGLGAIGLLLARPKKRS